MNKTKIHISVVIPMFNASLTIQRCLDSVVNQSFKQAIYEIIIINDGSKDNSAEIVSNYIETSTNRDVFNFIIINQLNGGVSKARNTGLKQSKGEYIAFLDSDDAWESNKIEMQIESFGKLGERLDFLGTAFEEIYLTNRSDGELIKINFNKLIFKNFFQPSTVMMRRRVFDQIGFFREDQKYAEEGNYFMRIAYKFNCYFLNTKLIKYGNDKSGFGDSGLSANLKEMEKGELMNLSYVYENKMINYRTYISAYMFSLAKYIRRILIVKLR